MTLRPALERESIRHYQTLRRVASTNQVRYAIVFYCLIEIASTFMTLLAESVVAVTVTWLP
jgi:hypothetical protein